MAGMLTVVNPRPRHKRHKNRRHRARRAHNRRRRARVYRHRADNPVIRRRSRRGHRRVHNRRRRHHNPRGLGGLFGGGMMTGVFQGLTFGAGAIGARIVANGINHFFFGAPDATGKETKPILAELPKIGLEAAVGVGGFMLLNAFKPTKQFARTFLIGAGVAVMFDIYDLYIKGMLPPYLQDYQYGELNGWAPQALAAYERGELNGAVYEGGVYG